MSLFVAAAMVGSLVSTVIVLRVRFVLADESRYLRAVEPLAGSTTVAATVGWLVGLVLRRRGVAAVPASLAAGAATWTMRRTVVARCAPGGQRLLFRLRRVDRRIAAVVVLAATAGAIVGPTRSVLRIRQWNNQTS